MPTTKSWSSKIRNKFFEFKEFLLVHVRIYIIVEMSIALKVSLNYGHNKVL